MYGLNRFEASNYVNGTGDSPDLPWIPRFAGNIFPFHGLSTAIRLENGGGKTRVANAIVGLLGRDKTLLSQVYNCMPASSERSNTWGHVRLEFIDCSPEMLDVVATQGIEQTDAECWVFGLAAFQSSSDHYFYFYRGRLEDAPTLQTTGDGEQHFIANRSFKDSVVSQGSAQWGATETEWREHIYQFVSKGNIQRLTEYQKSGSGDQSAQFFKARPRGSERFDQAFFYENLAPEIMSGLMGEVADENEQYVEDTLHKSLTNSIRDERVISESAETLKTCNRLALETSRAAEFAQAGQAAQARYADEQQRNNVIITVIRRLARGSTLPGLPNSPLPEHPATRLLANALVIAPGRGVMIRDSGLAAVTDVAVTTFNNKAQKDRHKVDRLTRVIAPTGPGSTPVNPEATKRGRYYAIQVARKIIESQASFANNWSRDRILQSMIEAQDWFEHAISANTPRLLINEIDAELTGAKATIARLSNEQSDLDTERTSLTEAQIAYQEGEKAYQTIKADPLFEADEADNAAELAGEVERQLASAKSALDSFTRQDAQLASLLPDWRAFVRAYSEDTDPAEVQNALIADEKNAKQDQERARQQDRIARKAARDASERARVTEREQDKALRAKTDLEAAAQRLRAFQDQFPDEAPADFEDTRRNRMTEITGRLSELVPEIRSLESAQDALFAFRADHGAEATPASWIESAIETREAAIEASRGLDDRISELARQLESLKNEKIAAAPIYDEAAGCLDSAGLNWEPLHNTLMSSDLAGDRRKDVLTHFSALIYAPVAPDRATAQRIAELLAEQRIPVPCFIQDAILEYAAHTPLTRSSDGSVEALLAGALTRDVACLLDPALIEREREAVDKALEQARAETQRHRSTAQRLAENGRQMTNAREAAEAIERGVESELPKRMAESKALDSEHRSIKSVLTQDTLDLVREARRYVAAGGETALDEATSRVRRAEQAHEKANSEAQAADDAIGVAEQAIKTADHTLENAFPSKMKVTLQQAVLFSSKNGPAFSNTRDATSERLNAGFLRATRRHAFKSTLITAGVFIAERERRGDGQSVHDRLAEIDRQMRLNGDELMRIKEQVEATGIRRVTVSTAVERVDEALAELQAQDALTADMLLNMEPGQHDSAAVARHPLMQSASRLMDAMQEKEADAAEQAAGDFAADLRELDLVERRSSMQAARQDRDSALRQMLAAVKSLREEESGLAATERELLAPVVNISQAAIVVQLATSYAAKAEQNREHHQRLQEAASTSMEESQERMADLMANADINLRTLQRVLNHAPNENAIRFDLRVKTPDREHALTIVQEIREAIRPDTVALEQKRQRQSMTSADQRSEDRRIRGNIRSQCYRRLFRDPELKFASPIIRADGGYHRLSDRLSTGQRTAITMAMLVRLTEYSMQRDSAKYETAAQRKRALGNQQTLMVIDGLFSDLSKRDLIDAGLTEIQSTRGHLQLIGLIHPPEYVNNFDYFPMFLVGQEHTGQGASWTEIKAQDDPHRSTSVHIGKLFMTAPPGRA